MTVKKLYEDGTVFDKNKKLWKAIGDDAERTVFEQLKQVLGNDPEATDAIVLQEMHLGKKSTSGGLQINEEEHDYIILFPKRKCFCPFEVKSTLVISNHHKAAVQLQKAQHMLQNYWWDIFDNDGWNICPTVYFSNKNKAHICPTNCEKWALFQETDFQRWWQELKNAFPAITDESEYQIARDKCLQVVQICLFNLHINVPKSQPLTTSNFLEEVKGLMKGVGTAHQVLFWNKNQYQLMNGSGGRFVVFASPYGTGKSVLMSHKCEEEAKKNMISKNGLKCLYVYGGRLVSKKYTLLQLKQMRKWQGQDFYQNIDILSYYDIAVSEGNNLFTT